MEVTIDIVAAVATVLSGLASAVWLLRHLARQSKLPKNTKYPPHVFSFVPVLGSAIELNQDECHLFIRKHARKFQSALFTANIAGQHCLFLTSENANVVDRERPEIDSYLLHNIFSINCLECTEEELKESYPDVAFKKKVRGLFPKHLLSKESLERNVPTIQQAMLETLHGRTGDAATRWTSIRLRDFVEEIIYNASIGPLLTKSIVSGEMRQHYKHFEDVFPLMFAGAPSFLTKQGRESCRELTKALQNDQHPSPLVKDRRDLIGSNIAQAKGAVGLMIAILGNSVFAVMWTFANLLSHPEAYQACLAEVEGIAATRGPEREFFSIEELNQMKVLWSSVQETCRLYHSLFIVRQVVKDFVLEPPPADKSGQRYLVEAGTRIMSSPNYVHHDPEIFEDPESFRYDRFLDPKALSKKGKPLSSHLRIFGGGSHLCPGRKIMEYQAKALVAAMLLKFDMRWAEGQKHPGINMKKQGIAINRPEHDPEVKIRQRKAGTS